MQKMFFVLFFSVGIAVLGAEVELKLKPRAMRLSVFDRLVACVETKVPGRFICSTGE
jgi:hypothetical protein